MNRVAARAEPSLEQQQLRRFAGAIDALDADQTAAIRMRRFEQGPGGGANRNVAVVGSEGFGGREI